MKCSRCKEGRAKKGTGLCGICEIVTSGEFPGVDHSALVPRHFNVGIGEWIEDKAHLKRRLRELESAGKIEGSDA